MTCLVHARRVNEDAPRSYGKNRISLAKRAQHHSGWEAISYQCRGSQVTRQHKSFLATTRITGGVIRVVIVRFEDGSWAPTSALIRMFQLVTY